MKLILFNKSKSFFNLFKCKKNNEFINYFKIIINNLDISDSSKKILNKIFSVESNKDYLDDVFEDFKKNEHLKYDNKFGKIINRIFK